MTNRVYDPVQDCVLSADAVAEAKDDGQYKRCRQDLYAVLANYSREDGIRALQKTLEEWV